MSNRLDDILMVLDGLTRDILHNPGLTHQDIIYYEQRLTTIKDLIIQYSKNAGKPDYFEVVSEPKAVQ